jgi:tetraacyldisaccharide-1-P 4'-kinase
MNGYSPVERDTDSLTVHPRNGSIGSSLITHYWRETHQFPNITGIQYGGQAAGKTETYILTVIEDRRRAVGHAPAWLLTQLSLLFATVIQIRLWLYSRGILRHHTLGCQVISVGNLTVGGTGKTPIVETFARALQRNGRKVAILSRGYKKYEPPFWEKLLHRLTFRELHSPPRVVSDGQRLLLDSEISGDEPFMLASNLPQVAVVWIRIASRPAAMPPASSGATR